MQPTMDIVLIAVIHTPSNIFLFSSITHTFAFIPCNQLIFLLLEKICYRLLLKFSCFVDLNLKRRDFSVDPHSLTNLCA